MFVSGILQSTVMTIFITKIVGSLSASESSFGWSLYLELTTLITSWFLLIIQIVVGCCCEYRYYEISNYYWWSTFLSINTLYFFGTIFINNLPLRTKDKILIKKNMMYYLYESWSKAFCCKCQLFITDSHRNI